MRHNHSLVERMDIAVRLEERSSFFRLQKSTEKGCAGLLPLKFLIFPRISCMEPHSLFLLYFGGYKFTHLSLFKNEYLNLPIAV